jgi:hypothetical protein
MGTSSGVVLLCSFWCHSSIQVPFFSGMWFLQQQQQQQHKSSL